MAGVPSLVSEEVGVPLWWRQYGDHQDPERSAHDHRRLTVEKLTAHGLRLRVESATRSGSMTSAFEVEWGETPAGGVTMSVDARLDVAAHATWEVTPHPDHGEVTFCTLWPAGVFSPAGQVPKRYQACFVARGAKVRRIEHHHLESRDKQHIRLKSGDRFAWGLEDWNPVLTIGAATEVEAGLCAYMWDAHFGLKICRDDVPVTLPSGTRLRAHYQLRVESRKVLLPLVQRARLLAPGRAADLPVWTGGRHSFRATFRSRNLDRNTTWPWTTQVLSGSVDDVAFARDCWVGVRDRYSLRIVLQAEAQAAWVATTLGPAFGEPPFVDGGRMQVQGMVRTDRLRGWARLRLRVHRQGRGSVYDVAGYETYTSDTLPGGEKGWMPLNVVTPPLSPRADRVHVLLEVQGEGTVWFDEVEFTRL
jgi:hypothetical protein